VVGAAVEVDIAPVELGSVILARKIAEKIEVCLRRRGVCW
jgi:hypothetical protein